MKREWRDVLTQILILKAAVLIVGIIVYFHRASQPANTGLLFARFWYQWDALRYLAIAENGYISSGPMKENIVFYPLFPLLIKTAGFVVRDVHLGGFLLAQILSVAGFLMFYGLARHEQGHQNALMSLWSLMLFPTAFFFHLPYTEGLFVLCAAGCFLASRTKRWMWAGIAGFFAVTTRITGMCLLPALMVEFYMQYRRREVSLKESAWLLLLPLGVMIFLGINHVVSGNAFSFMKYQAIIWHRHLAFPWVGLWGKIQVVLSGMQGDYWLHVGVMEALAGFFLIGATIVTIRKEDAVYGTYVACVALLCLSSTFILSVPRYIIGAFPVFFLRSPLNLHPRILGVLGVVQFVLMSYYLSRYLSAFWAF